MKTVYSCPLAQDLPEVWNKISKNQFIMCYSIYHTFSDASVPNIQTFFLDPYNLLIPVRGGTFCESAINSSYTLESWIQVTKLFNHFRTTYCLLSSKKKKKKKGAFDDVALCHKQ